MNALWSPLTEMRGRVSKTPLALASYDAFESLVKAKLVIWPNMSADRAAAYIMSVWAVEAARTGRIKIPKSDLHWIVSAGRHCRRKLKGAEAVWVKELAVHLLRINAKTEAHAQEPVLG